MVSKTRLIREFYHQLPAVFIVLLLASWLVAETLPSDDPRIKTILAPDKTRVMLGEPVYVSFIVHNQSAQDLQVIVGGNYRNLLRTPGNFTVTVQGENGKAVPQPSAGMSMGGIAGPKKMPAKGKYVFRLFLPHWASFEEVGTYSIVAKRTLKLSKHTPGRWDSREKTIDVQAQASTRIEIVPQDREKMGQLITALGDTMLGMQSDTAEPAALMLSYIQDERVVPCFVRALKTRSYEKKFTALRALARFRNEAAFQALKKGMETKAEDIGSATTWKVATQLAKNIRHTAAAALARCPHPGAIPFMLSKRNDPSEAVRITILHVLGKMKPEDAIPILQEMSHDNSKRVSEEAKRYLRLLSSKK